LEVENEGLKVVLLVIVGFRFQIQLFPNKNGKISVCTKFAVKKAYRWNDSRDAP
jgi:hypothetical protein